MRASCTTHPRDRKPTLFVTILLIRNVMVVSNSLLYRVQHKAWKVFAGESTDSSQEVAVLEASHFSIGGKHVKIMRPGQSEHFLTVKVLTQAWPGVGPQHPDPKPNSSCTLSCRQRPAPRLRSSYLLQTRVR